MSGDEHDARMDNMLGDAQRRIEDMADAHGPRDFAAVVGRAHRLDPEEVPAQMVEQAERLAPVVQLGAARHSVQEHARDQALDAVVRDARSSLEEHVAQRRLAGIPPLRPASSRAVGWTIRVGVLVAAAAGVVAVVMGFRTDPATRGDRAPEHSQAADQRERVAPDRAVSPHEGRGTAPLAPHPPPASAELRSDSQPVAAEPDPVRPAPRAKRVGASPDTTAESLADMDARAQRLWREGNPDGARVVFEEIIALDRAGKRADLAYGDLFTLARQSGASERLAKLRREYLARFPRGRFADDARAGACRKATPACWREYLADFPDGSYVDEARRAVEAGSTP